jgi:hypothetical protein
MSDRSGPFDNFEADLRTRLGDVYRRNGWVTAVDVEQGAVRMAAAVRQLSDGQPVLAVGARPGIGPTDPEIPLVSIGLEWTESLMTNIRTAEAALVDPPAEVLAAVDRWDPHGTARTIGSTTSVKGTLAGRPTFGSRPASWAALEDKLAVEALWRAAGVTTAASAQVDLGDVDASLEAHRGLAAETAGGDHSSVWALDNADGWHGGGAGTFQVRSEAEARELAARYGPGRRVRIMPFIEGVPCSIHGMVLPTGDGSPSAVAVFRPAEMMTLRNTDTGAFAYGRASTFWDPSPADRNAMRHTAKLIGTELAGSYGYRGTFTVDGVVGPDGFVPTEVNPRYGAALRIEPDPAATAPPVNLYLLHLAIVEGQMNGIDPTALEQWLVTQADARRWMSGFVSVANGPDTERLAVVSAGANGTLDLVEVDPDAGPAPETASSPDRLATVRWGAAQAGGMLMVDGGPAVPVGPPSAPLLAEIIGAADRRWGLDAPPLAAANPVFEGRKAQGS